MKNKCRNVIITIKSNTPHVNNIDFNKFSGKTIGMPPPYSEQILNSILVLHIIMTFRMQYNIEAIIDDLREAEAQIEVMRYH